MTVNTEEGYFPSYQKGIPHDAPTSTDNDVQSKRIVSFIGTSLLILLTALLSKLTTRSGNLNTPETIAAIRNNANTGGDHGLETKSAIITTDHTRREHIFKTLRDLQTTLEGTIYFPDDTYFDEAAHVWRVSVGPPWAVIQVANEEDVQKTIPVLATLQKDYNFDFSIRSGGHNKAGYSTASEGAVISLVRLNQIELLLEDDETGTAVVKMGPGVVVKQFSDELLTKRGYGGVIGWCKSVAEAGFVMGGGIGLQSRLHGLGADNVKGFRIVLADGTVQYVSNDSESDDDDLFFALRGAGGGSFGVVTEIDYYIHKAANRIFAQSIHLDTDPMATLLYRLGQKEATLPGNVVAMYDLIDQVTVFFTGRNDEEMIGGQEYLTDFIDEIHPTDVPRNITPVDVPWTDVYEMEPVEVADWGNAVWAAGCWCGFMMPENNTEEVWKVINRQFSKGIEESAPYLLPDVELWGGKIHDTPWNETAFPHRDAVYNVGVLLLIQVGTVDAEAVFQEQSGKINAWWPNVQQYLQGSFVNYPMTAMADGDYARVYWGDNLPRLVDIKRRVDPHNIFRFPMSVPMEQ